VDVVKDRGRNDARPGADGLVDPRDAARDRQRAMQFGDILVCMDDSTTGRKRTEFALNLAMRTHARVIGYYLRRRHRPAVEDFLDVPNTAIVEDVSNDFERQLRLRGLDGTWVLGSVAHAAQDIANHARCADLVVAGLGFPDDPSSDPQNLDIEQLVVECACPVLGIPITNGAGEIGRDVMVAWDGSRGASRAMRDALPFLHAAATVRLVSIERNSAAVASPSDAVAHLRRLGITASIDKEMDLQLPVGEEILSRIDREGVDLLVAGVFGHSRLLEHIFGGVSRSLLHQMMIPVLASH
jgi:nucleotide-binding universal stress UspA family protein